MADTIVPSYVNRREKEIQRNLAVNVVKVAIKGRT
jgi:hypothetical protein